jgi:hypothetical protein
LPSAGVYAQITSYSQEQKDPAEEEAKNIEVKERKSYIKGLKGTDSLSISRVVTASMLVPGYAQAYNRQYWKIPALYAGGAALIYGGARSNALYRQTGKERYLSQSKYCYAGAGLFYLAGLIDGLTNYKTPKGVIVPVKATFYSAFLPGLGQAYNGDYWKIPLIYGGFAFWAYWLDINAMQYNRFRNAYNIEDARAKGDTEQTSEFEGRLSLESIRSYRDSYRRQRDYAVLYLALWYAVNIVDATVFAQLSNFDVSENLSFNISPALIPLNLYAQGEPAIGFNLKIGLK